MSPIRAISQRKACVACANSKRKCDKKLPECQRCLDRDVDCAYPHPRKRRRNPVIEESAEALTLDDYAGAITLEKDLSFTNWGTIEAVDLDVPLPDVMLPYIPTLPLPASDLPSQGAVPDIGQGTRTSHPWFLEDKTWVMRRCNEEPTCEILLELDPFVQSVEQMLKSWVTHGYSGFIHQRLYEKGMPTCLQDAFTTLSTYNSRTAAVRETILQIAEERSVTLVQQSQITAASAQGILNQLARVQSLFVYVFIRLFDGSIRVRASAERQLPTLRQWVTRMWETAKDYRGNYLSLNDQRTQWTASEFDRDYDSASSLWNLWILTESVRRSHLIIDVVLNVYQTMTIGWADCAGAVMFTARRGLWEAQSAVQWLELCTKYTPLLVPSLRPGPLVATYKVEEIDEFAKVVWKFLIGRDKMQCWIDRSSSKSGT